MRQWVPETFTEWLCVWGNILPRPNPTSSCSSCIASWEGSAQWRGRKERSGVGERGGLLLSGGGKGCYMATLVTHQGPVQHDCHGHDPVHLHTGVNRVSSACTIAARNAKEGKFQGGRHQTQRPPQDVIIHTVLVHTCISCLSIALRWNWIMASVSIHVL